MITYEEKIHELEKTFAREQDKNVFFEVDLAKSRQELRKSFSPFIIAGKRSAKFLDLIVFTESDDSTFES